jgi:hypothetical protein
MAHYLRENINVATPPAAPTTVTFSPTAVGVSARAGPGATGGVSARAGPGAAGGVSARVGPI